MFLSQTKTVVPFYSAFIVTSIGFTFTAGTAAKAEEVNANFQTLATAIDAALPATISSNVFYPSVATNSSLSGRNVVVMRQVGTSGANNYYVVTSYNDGSNDVSDIIFISADSSNENTVLAWQINRISTQRKLRGCRKSGERAWLLKNFVPEGIRGLAFAALVAAGCHRQAFLLLVPMALAPAGLRPCA